MSHWEEHPGTFPKRLICNKILGHDWHYYESYPSGCYHDCHRCDARTHEDLWSRGLVFRVRKVLGLRLP